MSLLSIIIPAYNEGALIQNTASVVADIMEKHSIDYEIVFVNDGSKDATWDEIQKAHRNNEKVCGVCFSRNFGKEGAVFAGLEYAKGDCCVVMDCDLQHPPETIIEMYHLWERGYEVIEGVKADRGKESFIHKIFVKMFYGMMSESTGIDMSRASDFKLLDRKAVDAFIALPERHVFFRALSSWVGFKTTYVEFEVRDREAGQSKWSTWSLIKYAFTNIVAFTTAPLQFVTVVGGACFGCSLILIIYSLVQFFAGRAVEGYTTTLIVLLLIGSAIMLSLGIIGYYIAKIYEEVKRRPRYIISQILRGKEDVYQEVNHDRSH